MPHYKNDTNSNNHIQAANSNNFLQITDININDDKENNDVPYYNNESPYFSEKNSLGIDAAGQFLYENNINYNKPVKSIFSAKTDYIFGVLFGNINKYQIANGLFGPPPFLGPMKNIGPRKGGIFGNINKDQIANDLFGPPLFVGPMKNIGPTKGGIFGNITFG